MKICIDARPVTEQMHGISRYVLNLIMQLALIDQKHEYLLLTGPSAKKLLPSLPENFRLKDCRTPNYSVSEQAVIPWLLKKESVDVFHSTTYSAPVFQPCKTIVTIHDLIPLIFPEDYRWIHTVYYRQVVQRSLKKVQSILTVSQSSKGDLVRFFGLDQNRIVVTYNGVDDRFSPDVSGLSKKRISEVFNIKGPFILSVVNQKPHKNVAVLIRAFERFMKKAKVPYKLVIVGIGGTDELKNISDAIHNSLIFLRRVTDDQLITLYQNAALFVLPTLYEGFCLPVLEAMACGTPVITSNVSSLPEIAGDAAVLINPDNIDELAGAIYNVLANKDLQKVLREKGIRQARRFSWRETAQQTLKVYEEVLGLGG